MWLVIVSKALIALLLLVSFVLLLIAGKEEPTYAAAKWITVLFKGNPPGIVIGFAVSKTRCLNHCQGLHPRRRDVPLWLSRVGGGDGPGIP